MSEWSSYSNARNKAKVCRNIARDIDSVNESNGQRGIVIDMNWAAIYSIYSQ